MGVLEPDGWLEFAGASRSRFWLWLGVVILILLALLVATGLGRLLQEPDGLLFVEVYTPLLAWTALCLCGMVWGAFRVFRVAPNGQGLSIAALIGSTLALVVGPWVYTLVVALRRKL